tara:strand:+ start:232 stop:447 length:216 start_codon:yes stop_codon:yes gene_type:complete
MITWRELYKIIIRKASKENRNLPFSQMFIDETVTVYDAADGEYYPADMIEFEEADDVLDAGHMFIVINLEK